MPWYLEQCDICQMSFDTRRYPCYLDFTYEELANYGRYEGSCHTLTTKLSNDDSRNQILFNDKDEEVRRLCKKCAYDCLTEHRLYIYCDHDNYDGATFGPEVYTSENLHIIKKRLDDEYREKLLELDKVFKSRKELAESQTVSQKLRRDSTR